MTQSAAQAAAFYRDVAKSRVLWTLEDDEGYPAPLNQEGKRSMPFWSSLARVEKIIKEVPAYAGFRPAQFSWDEFVNRWVPELAAAGELVGVNWSGKLATGYDAEPEAVVRNVNYYLQQAKKVLPFPVQ